MFIGAHLCRSTEAHLRPLNPDTTVASSQGGISVPTNKRNCVCSVGNKTARVSAGPSGSRVLQYTAFFGVVDLITNAIAFEKPEFFKFSGSTFLYGWAINAV